MNDNRPAARLLTPYTNTILVGPASKAIAFVHIYRNPWNDGESFNVDVDVYPLAYNTDGTTIETPTGYELEGIESIISKRIYNARTKADAFHGANKFVTSAHKTLIKRAVEKHGEITVPAVTFAHLVGTLNDVSADMGLSLIPCKDTKRMMAELDNAFEAGTSYLCEQAQLSELFNYSDEITT